MKLLYAFSIYFFSAGVSFAAPPPPEILPDKFPKEIEGYNIGDIYSIFARKIEHSYTDALYRRAKYVEKYKGPRIIFNGGGWTRGSKLYQYNLKCENDCIWTYHTLKLDRNYFKELASQTFNPNEFVEDLKQAKISPDDIWYHEYKIDEKIIEMLIQNVNIKSLSQTQCPAVLESLEVLEGLKVPEIDIEGVGKDQGKDSPVLSDQSWIEIELPTLERKTGFTGEIIISGYGRESYAGQLSKKIFEPIKPCFDN